MPPTHFTQEQMDQAVRLSSLMQVRFLVCERMGEAIFADPATVLPCAADDDGAGTTRRTVPFTELAVYVGGLSDVLSCRYFSLPRIPCVSFSLVNHGV